MLTLITHAGIFHGDEVMATAILKYLFPDAPIKRVNFITDEDRNNPDNIIYDIGYGKFDHHQKNGNGFHEDGTPYAACGLIWNHFGLEICINAVKDVDEANYLFKKIEKELIIGVDAHDTGYRDDKEYSISEAIKTFNPTWNSKQTENDAFNDALFFAKMIFKNIMNSAIAEVIAKNTVKNIVENSSDNFIILDKYMPWQSAVKDTDIDYVIYPSNRGGYNVQTAPGKNLLPEEWRGLVPSALQEITGVEDVIFCHSAGFLASAKTQLGAMLLVKKANDLIPNKEDIKYILKELSDNDNEEPIRNWFRNLNLTPYEKGEAKLISKSLVDTFDCISIRHYDYNACKFTDVDLSVIGISEDTDLVSVRYSHCWG